MRIGLPTGEEPDLESPVAQHFGRAPRYIAVDLDSREFESAPNQGHHFGGDRHPPETLADLGVDVVLAGDIGRGAVTRFEQRGIEVYRGATGTVSESIQQWEAGDLEQVGPEDVHGHGHGDEDHHDHEHH